MLAHLINKGPDCLLNWSSFQNLRRLGGGGGGGGENSQAGFFLKGRKDYLNIFRGARPYVTISILISKGGRG